MFFSDFFSRLFRLPSAICGSQLLLAGGSACPAFGAARRGFGTAYGSVKRNEPKTMLAYAVCGVPGATYHGARVRYEYWVMICSAP
jgi:hypothetical protein